MAKKPISAPPNKYKEEEDWLDCDLTNAELQEKGEALAKLEEKLAQNTAAKKAAMAEFKRTEDGIAASINLLAHHINTKRENRLVKVKIEFNYATKMYLKIRLDTGECFFRRPLTKHELQGDLFDGGDDDDDD